VRHVDFGEGGYTTTEEQIRQLLVAAHTGIFLPPPTDVPDKTPMEETNPETWIGSEREKYLISPQTPTDHPVVFSLPASIAAPELALCGTWTVSTEEATSDADAELELGYQAKDVCLVLGGTGALRVDPGDGGPLTTLDISGFPRLYTLLAAPTLQSGVMTLHLSPGMEACDFTFGWSALRRPDGV
jgi:hypothetical protein